MLALAPKLHEEIVFQNGDVEIKLKFYLNKDRKLRIAITVPASVSVSRRKIEIPIEEKIPLSHRFRKKSMNNNG